MRTRTTSESWEVGLLGFVSVALLSFISLIFESNGRDKEDDWEVEKRIKREEEKLETMVERAKWNVTCAIGIIYIRRKYMPSRNLPVLWSCEVFDEI